MKKYSAFALFREGLTRPPRLATGVAVSDTEGIL